MTKIVFGVVFALVCLFVAEASLNIQSTTHKKKEGAIKANLCPTCVDFSDQAINTLLNIILQYGITGGCGEVCGLLANKTGNANLGELCSFICDLVGVELFSKLLQKADLDPIYFCELISLCPVNDNGDATISNLTVTPAMGPVGTTFTVSVVYDSKNGTGTGELEVAVTTLDGIPVGGNFILQAQPAGKGYESQVKVNAKPDPNCDPTTQPCENWLPGNYTVGVAVCSGECGSKHAHSKVYDRKKTSFMITDK